MVRPTAPPAQRYDAMVLTQHDTPRLTGEHVTDLMHLYGLSRAGFTPELFSLKFSLPGQAVVRDLLRECNGKALLYDEHFATLVTDIPLPRLPLVDISTLPPSTDALQPLPEVSEEDAAIIFHTSGTTSAAGRKTRLRTLPSQFTAPSEKPNVRATAAISMRLGVVGGGAPSFAMGPYHGFGIAATALSTT